MLMILRWDENESQGFWLSSYGAKSSLELGSKCESGDSSPQPRACSLARRPSVNHIGPSSTQAEAAFQVQASRASRRSWLCPWKCSRSFLHCFLQGIAYSVMIIQWMRECVEPGREKLEKSAEVDFWAVYSSILTHSHTNKTEDK